MLKLNNKGQSLAMFILIIPIILLTLTLVYDIGTALYEKERLSNTNYLVISYGLDNLSEIDENILINLINKNSTNLSSISVLIEDETINIKISKKIKGVLGKAFGFDLIEAVSEYTGTKRGTKKEIERIKWYHGRKNN